MQTNDTIVAISSATGVAARMIVRLSGVRALDLVEQLSGSRPGHATAQRGTIRFNGLAVPTWVYAFHGPRSSTGEDVVELHLPGNPSLAKMLVTHLLASGARGAEPGEFTARAYFNGKLDLTEAEGVAATIAARSDAELQAARQLLAGELARRVRPIVDSVAETLALIEVGIDFTDEDVTFLSTAEVADRLRAAATMIEQLLAASGQIESLAHEPTVVLVGRPNAGKSTLLNALAGHERAVVSPIAGTTRDVVWAHVPLRRGQVRMIDVAGLEAAPDGATVTADIERAMQSRATDAIAAADVVLHLHAADDAQPPLVLDRPAHLLVRTKQDACPSSSSDDGLFISAQSGYGLDELRDRLDAIGFTANERTTLTLNARHHAHLHDAADALSRAMDVNEVEAGPEVIAVELRETLDALGAIVGTVSPDELLGRVFSKFCIGK